MPDCNTMYYMSKLISIRIADDLIARLDAFAGARERSRTVSEAVRRMLDGATDRRAEGRTEAAEVGRAGERAAVPVMRESASTTERLHPVQSVRNKLAGRRGPGQGPAPGQGAVSEHEGHIVLPNGEKRWCTTCKVDC
jgi:predicted transcriptional regulator